MRPVIALLLLLLAAILSGPVVLGASTEECGQQPSLGSSPVSRVIGGHSAPLGAWPWSVSLQHHQPGGPFTHICGGVLVKERAVLTAAHCVTGRNDPYSWRAVLGVHNLWQPSRHTERRSIRSITVHPEYKKELHESDLAIFELAKAVRYSDYIQAICLPPAHLQPEPANATTCFISGWGRTAEKGKPSAVLQEAQVEIIPSNICGSSEAYGALVNDKMICAGSLAGGTDTCQGDSGGPLACSQPGSNRYYLLGIASFGVGCGRPKFPGIYVRVSHYSQWLTAQLLLRSKAVSPSSIPLTILLTLLSLLVTF